MTVFMRKSANLQFYPGTGTNTTIGNKNAVQLQSSSGIFPLSFPPTGVKLITRYCVFFLVCLFVFLRGEASRDVKHVIM
eukprot:1029885-Rhodomonas_salina.1